MPSSARAAGPARPAAGAGSGAATARAEAHTVRLAVLYALLDCSPSIRVEHLDAALAFWHYASESARWVFGDSLGDPTRRAGRDARHRLTLTLGAAVEVPRRQDILMTS